jgi:hypothetical protein
MLWKVVALLHNISSFCDCSGLYKMVALYNKRVNKVNQYETPKIDCMQVFNNNQSLPKYDLFFFLKSLIKNSFSITGMQLETMRTEFSLSSSSSPYIKRLNGYQNHLNSEPIIIYI